MRRPRCELLAGAVLSCGGRRHVGRLPPDSLQLAMRCSVADLLALDLVVELAGLPDLAAAESALSDLEAAGIGMWSVSTLGRTFQISEALRER